MTATSIYQTMKSPVPFFSVDSQAIIESMPFETFSRFQFSHKDAISLAWQSYAEQAAESVVSNMECCESINDIVNALKCSFPEVSISRLGAGLFELSRKGTPARLWLRESSAGEITVYFFKDCLPDACMTARGRYIELITKGRGRIDISDFGPGTAASFIAQLFHVHGQLSQRCLSDWGI